MRLPPLLLVMCLCAATYGCASAPEQQTNAAVSPNGSPSNSIPAPHREPRYRTGSRLPQGDDDGGSATVGGASRDAYEDDRRGMATPQKW